MEILSRSDAIARQQRHYFTGRPCKHGHVAPRYVQSCTCVECIAQAVGRDRAAARANGPTAAQRAYKTEVVDRRFRLPIDSLPMLQAVAAALLEGRYPDLGGRYARVVEPRPVRPAGGTAMVRLRVHPDDVVLVQALCNQETARHSAEQYAAWEARRREGGGAWEL